MNYADENFYQKRHTKTPDGKDHNGNVYYGIQLRSSENYFKNQEAKDNLPLSDKSNFTSEKYQEFLNKNQNIIDFRCCQIAVNSSCCQIAVIFNLLKFYVVLKIKIIALKKAQTLYITKV